MVELAYRLVSFLGLKLDLLVRPTCYVCLSHSGSSERGLLIVMDLWLWITTIGLGPHNPYPCCEQVQKSPLLSSPQSLLQNPTSPPSFPPSPTFSFYIFFSFFPFLFFPVSFFPPFMPSTWFTLLHALTTDFTLKAISLIIVGALHSNFKFMLYDQESKLLIKFTACTPSIVPIYILFFVENSP